jgi:hypothetical protein
MGKRRYKVGDKVEFKFTGSMNIGVITEVVKENEKLIAKYSIDDGKYLYPIYHGDVQKKIK